jgi:hypothetical protein
MIDYKMIQDNINNYIDMLSSSGVALSSEDVKLKEFCSLNLDDFKDILRENPDWAIKLKIRFGGN